MNFISRLARIALLVCIGAVSSCRYPVTYKISQEGRKLSQHFPVAIQVARFDDKAPKHQSVRVKSGDESWKTNAISVYKNQEFAKGISTMIARDLESTKMFAHVVQPDMPAGSAHYALRGTVWDFSAVGLWKTIPETAVIISSVAANIPGLLMSAAATCWVRTDVVSSVILTDVRILDLRSGAVIWTCPPLRSGGQKRVRWSQAECSSLVDTANGNLQEVVTQLVNRMNENPPEFRN